MQKISFVLIPVLILVAKSLNYNPETKRIPIQKPLTVYHEPAVPRTNDDALPVIEQKIDRVFSPIPYGNASKIAFSNNISFDTRNLGKSGEPYLPADMVYRQGESRYYIVQFTGPVYSTQKDWLNKQGIGIHFYIPHYGFVCTIEDIDDLAHVRANPSVNWVGIYHPAYKVSSLFDRVGERSKVTILLFLDADINSVLTNIELVTRYRRQSLRGSWTKRYNHSNPRFCIHRGAMGKVPAWKSNAAPTQIWTAQMRSRWS